MIAVFIKALFMPFIFSIASANADSKALCNDFFINSQHQFTPHKGRLFYENGIQLTELRIWSQFLESNEAKFALPELEPFRVYILGVGKKGGSVFRIESTREAFETYILKLYRDEASLTNDLRAYRILREFLKGTSLVKIPKHTKIGNYVLKMQNIEGETLHNLVKPENRHRVDAEKLLRRHRIKMQMIHRVLHQRIPHEQLSGKIIFKDTEKAYLLFSLLHGPQPKQKTRIFLKPDNIIVDAVTLEFWFTDPY